MDCQGGQVLRASPLEYQTFYLKGGLDQKVIKAFQEYLDLLGAREIKDFLVYLD